MRKEEVFKILNCINLTNNKFNDQMNEQINDSAKVKLYLWYTIYLDSKQKIITKLYNKEKVGLARRYNSDSFTVLDYLFAAGVKIKPVEKYIESSNEIPIIIENINEYGISLDKGALIGTISYLEANINNANSKMLKRKRRRNGLIAMKKLDEKNNEMNENKELVEDKNKEAPNFDSFIFDNALPKIDLIEPDYYEKFNSIPLKARINQICSDFKSLTKLYAKSIDKAIEKIRILSNYISKKQKGQSKKRIKAEIVFASLESCFLYLTSNRHYNYCLFEDIIKKMTNINEAFNKIA